MDDALTKYPIYLSKHLSEACGVGQMTANHWIRTGTVALPPTAGTGFYKTFDLQFAVALTLIQRLRDRGIELSVAAKFAEAVQGLYPPDDLHAKNWPKWLIRDAYGEMTALFDDSVVTIDREPDDWGMVIAVPIRSLVRPTHERLQHVIASDPNKRTQTFALAAMGRAQVRPRKTETGRVEFVDEQGKVLAAAFRDGE